MTKTNDIEGIVEHQEMLISSFVPDPTFRQYHDHQIAMLSALNEVPKLEARIKELEEQNNKLLDYNIPTNVGDFSLRKHFKINKIASALKDKK